MVLSACNFSLIFVAFNTNLGSIMRRWRMCACLLCSLLAFLLFDLSLFSLKGQPCMHLDQELKGNNPMLDMWTGVDGGCSYSHGLMLTVAWCSIKQ